MLKMNCRKLLVVKVITARGSVAQGLEDSRNRADACQRLLCRKRPKRDMVIHECRARLANDALVRLHIGNSLAIAVPQDVEQPSAELLPRGGKGNLSMGTGGSSVGHWKLRPRRLDHKPSIAALGSASWVL